MSESNAILAERILAKDENAVRELFARYHWRVYSLCMRMLRHHQDAEDVTQETFTRAVRYLDRWDSDRPLEPWIVAIAGNRCRSFLASRRGHQSLSPAVEPAIDTHMDVAFANLNEEVDLALMQLVANQRTAFEMFHRQGMGYQEIADRLDRPVGTIKTWIHRARMQLIQQLQEREVVHPPKKEKNAMRAAAIGAPAANSVMEVDS